MYSEKGAIGTIRTTDLCDEGTINYQTIPYANLDVNEFSSHILESGDLLITRSGSCGIPCIFEKQEKPIVAGAFLIRFKLKGDVDPSYLHSLLKYDVTQHHISKMASGGVQKNLTGTSLKKLKLQLPELLEQRKVAKILSTWDKAISAIERLIDNSKQQKKALMQQLLTGKKRLLDDSGMPFEGEWEDRKLEDISSLMTDYVANGSFQSLRENVNVTESKDYALYVRLVDLRAGLGHSEQKYVDKESFNFLKKSCLQGGELLMANIGANVGEVWQMPNVDLPATLAPNMLMTKFKSYIDSGYVFFFLASDFGQNRISKVIAGSGHPKINKTELKQVKVLLPPLKEQQKITKVLINAGKEIELLERQLADLKQEKKALMQQLLTGKRRVKIDDKEVAQCQKAKINT
ncbi:hypothetical protein HHX48_08165 [Salinimonas sp. HHU 13199]|uniref:Type I restriction modification DNA specificity domain-containing protein n=1 Tax=Salinimonas profundi TaxID=2729140 RepID=A0ABR8LHJ1_9ALTE|nr:restriction endonuclease subunit S [Salinimonas profundi]MBD3585704.1 hypothetical protein [Salinimonas profundi]